MYPGFNSPWETGASALLTGSNRRMPCASSGSCADCACGSNSPRRPSRISANRIVDLKSTPPAEQHVEVFMVCTSRYRNVEQDQSLRQVRIDVPSERKQGIAPEVRFFGSSGGPQAAKFSQTARLLL